MQMEAEEKGWLRHFHKIVDRNHLTVSRHASWNLQCFMTKRRTAIGLFVLSEEFWTRFRTLMRVLTPIPNFTRAR
jgi:hypothetical protein